MVGMRRVGIAGCLLTLTIGCQAPARPLTQESEPKAVAEEAKPLAVSPPADPIRPGAPASIAVSVGTVWGSPDFARQVDQPALENPVRIKDWLAAMTLSERRDLGPTRVNTSVLLGEVVQVLSRAGDWAEVVVPSQKSPRDPRGYPGWIPARQLSPQIAPADRDIATVTAKTTKLRPTKQGSELEVSYSTRLPVLGGDAANLEVWSPTGDSMLVARKDVSVTKPDVPALPPTAEAIVEDARRFMGLPYLWDGSSAYGFDCSGITYSVFRTHGVLLPRDSFGQAEVGTTVPQSDLDTGDLVFFAPPGGKVHHVGIYIGGGHMLHAPKTGSTVEIADLSTSWFPGEYHVARRFVD